MSIADGDPIPAVTEDAVAGETAAFFDDIRRVLGVPVVNLVWRHLATFPGGLAWAWGAIRPFYVAGQAAREGAQLLDALPLPRLPAWTRRDLRAAAVDEIAERTVARVLDSYNRSNAMNLVALTALGLQLEERPPEVSSPIESFGGVVASGAAPSVEGPLPGLLGLEQMAPATSELVRQLDRLGDQGDGRIRASMYRHLAHWPGFLELAWTLIAPLDGDGRLRELIDAASDLAHDSSPRVTRRLAAPGSAPSTATRAAVQAALAEFTGGVIARMVPIGALLRRALAT